MTSKISSEGFPAPHWPLTERPNLHATLKRKQLTGQGLQTHQTVLSHLLFLRTQDDPRWQPQQPLKPETTQQEQCSVLFQWNAPTIQLCNSPERLLKLLLFQRLPRVAAVSHASWQKSKHNRPDINTHISQRWHAEQLA